jgi:hypothetical protein
MAPGVSATMTREPTLVYFGAGWDCAPLGMKAFRATKNFVFIDALPELPHYSPGQAGYKFVKDRQSFIRKITHEARRKGFILYEDRGNRLQYISPSECWLDYYINTSVEAALSSPGLSRCIQEAQIIYIAGFEPRLFGLDIKRDMPKLERIIVDHEDYNDCDHDNLHDGDCDTDCEDELCADDDDDELWWKSSRPLPTSIESDDDDDYIGANGPPSTIHSQVFISPCGD